IFKQKRVGKNGKVFEIYKFRSMYLDAEERKKELMAQNELTSDLMFKMDNDPRIFPFGQKMRNWSLDELPQFINVLKGDMSLIGTRPPTLNEYEKYELHHFKRLAMKPGITGMWQVSGRSNITDFEEVVALDLSYIKNWSVWLDIKIFLKTIKVVLVKEGSK
ncbi:sugar transferase, partial [Streptococcus hyointestinalis]